jgi:neutral ceramidase
VRETSGAPLACDARIVALPPASAGAAVPRLIRRGASNLLAAFAEPFAIATRIDVGGLALQGVPGEPVGSLGHSDVQLIALADGYVGYVEDPRRAASGEGESARTYYGPDLARVLLEHR